MLAQVRLLRKYRVEVEDLLELKSRVNLCHLLLLRVIVKPIELDLQDWREECKPDKLPGILLPVLPRIILVISLQLLSHCICLY